VVILGRANRQVATAVVAPQGGILFHPPLGPWAQQLAVRWNCQFGLLLFVQPQLSHCHMPLVSKRGCCIWPSLHSKNDMLSVKKKCSGTTSKPSSMVGSDEQETRMTCPDSEVKTLKLVWVP
jgi:hypothetical protein